VSADHRCFAALPVHADGDLLHDKAIDSENGIRVDNDPIWVRYQQTTANLAR
jgi:hypothetical protein